VEQSASDGVRFSQKKKFADCACLHLFEETLEKYGQIG
jgi:hypothetical protein